MKKRYALGCIAASLPVADAYAGSDRDCFAPLADWRPRAEVARLAAEQGWTYRRIKIDDGCYEIDGRDAQGRIIEVTINPATLEILDIEYGHDEDDDNDSHAPKRKERRD